MREINVGLIGLGTVGTGLVKIFQTRMKILQKQTGLDIRLRKICDKDWKRPRDIRIDRQLCTDDVRQIIKDPRIDIVVELIGGVSPAKEFIIDALENGKHVVTANKALLAQHWDDLFAKAKENERDILFEASVCGAIPIIKIVRESLVDNKIHEVFGIVNGTANFILTKMQDEMLDFKKALRLAQERGYAERDPSYDIKGIDAAHKLAILSTLAFGKRITFKDIYVEGIDHISEKDIAYAEALGYSIKLLAIAKTHVHTIEARVHPTLIPKRHLLASVRDVYNAVFIRGDLVGEQLFYGRGAGQLPTASAVMSDIVALAYHMQAAQTNRRFTPYAQKEHVHIRDMNDVEARYYLKILALDKPGVLASIAGILGRNKISISTVVQQERKKGAAVPVVLVTHEAKERDLRKALATINAMPVIKEKSVAIRIEQDL